MCLDEAPVFLESSYMHEEKATMVFSSTLPTDLEVIALIWLYSLNLDSFTLQKNLPTFKIKTIKIQWHFPLCVQQCHIKSKVTILSSKQLVLLSAELSRTSSAQEQHTKNYSRLRKWFSALRTRRTSQGVAHLETLTSRASSWELYRGQSFRRLEAPSSTSQSSFRNTPQKGTTLQPGMCRARVTTFLYSREDSCWAMASFRLLMVSMSDWSINCHIFRTFLDLLQVNDIFLSLKGWQCSLQYVDWIPYNFIVFNLLRDFPVLLIGLLRISVFSYFPRWWEYYLCKINYKVRAASEGKGT